MKYKSDYTEKNKCKDCGKLISNEATRCRVCANKFKNKNYKGKNNPNFKHGKCIRINYNCIDCGKKIKNVYAKRCSSCAMKLRYKLFPEKNPWYAHGNSNKIYPKKFYELKEQICKRDNHTCQECGKTQEEHLDKFNQSLSIHHIDYDKDNNSEDNLITLCINCHMKTNFKRDYWKLYFKEKMINELQRI